MRVYVPLREHEYEGEHIVWKGSGCRSSNPRVSEGMSFDMANHRACACRIIRNQDGKTAIIRAGDVVFIDTSRVDDTCAELF